MTRSEPCFVFRLNGRELCRYTIRGTFVSEAKNTRELLAYENDVDAEDIKITIERWKGETKNDL